MRLLIFSIIFLIGSSATYAQQTRHEKRVSKYKSNWMSLIPTHTKIHYAGSMGLISVGTGWDYGKRNQWETDIILGYLPKYSTQKAKVVFTVKQNFIPWKKDLGSKGFFFEPLTCGLYATAISGSGFWRSQPDKYPSGYYPFSTKLRFNIFVGERIGIKIPKEKRLGFQEVSFFYEISTCELYVISAVQNSYLKPTDYLKLSLGLKFQLF